MLSTVTVSADVQKLICNKISETKKNGSYYDDTINLELGFRRLALEGKQYVMDIYGDKLKKCTLSTFDHPKLNKYSEFDAVNRNEYTPYCGVNELQVKWQGTADQMDLSKPLILQPIINKDYYGTAFYECK